MTSTERWLLMLTLAIGVWLPFKFGNRSEQFLTESLGVSRQWSKFLALLIFGSLALALLMTFTFLGWIKLR